jgi:DNA-binding NtrC family response regulator
MTRQVLVVDDDVDVAESYAEILRNHGCAVEIVHNGRDAVERFKGRDYDIAFMDIRMPVMDGIDSFLEIKRMKPEARVVLVSGHSDERAEKALANGALAVLMKPVRLKQLVAFLRTGA